MIWNEEVLFLHPQKTAGMALTDVLMGHLKPPMFNALPHGHRPKKDWPGVVFVSGLRHENMLQAREQLAEHMRELSDFKVILVPMRNPYDMEVSRYFHLRKRGALEVGEERQLACELSFCDFAIKSRFRSLRPDNRPLEEREAIANYYTIDGKELSNLCVVRYENMQQDLNDHLGKLGYPELQIPVLNVSSEREGKSFPSFITAEVEEAIYKRYRFIFDRQYYPRVE